jgi:hypothetical protein
MANSKVSRKSSIPAAVEHPVPQAVASASPKPPRKPAVQTVKVVQAAPAEKVVVNAPLTKAPVTKTPAEPRAPRVTKPVVASVPVVPENPPDKSVKVKRAKLIRDSYTMPQAEHAAIAVLKKRCLNLGVAAKKSEILRAALAVLARMSDVDVAAAIQGLAVIKTGRPSKNAK